MRIIRFLVRLLSVALCSGVVGLGVGFLQGTVVYSGETRAIEMAFAECATVIGGTVGLLLGPFVCYGIFGQKVSFATFAYIVSMTVITAVLGGWLLAFMGWMTMFPTIVAAIAASVYMASRHARDTLAEPER